MARPEKYSDEDLVKEAMEFQRKYPLYSETAICGLLEVGREYIADRAKTSKLVAETREVMSTIRQGAWEQKGIEMMNVPAQNQSPVIYIWMTRNMLGWRNDQAPSLPGAGQPPGGETLKLYSPADYLELLKAKQAAKNTDGGSKE